MLRHAVRALGTAFCLMPLLATPALAEGGKGKGRDKTVIIRDDGKKVVFVDDDRRIYRDWWRSTYGMNCPPGLARKGKGCYASGYTGRRYVVGRALPRTVIVEPVPKVLLSRLREPAYGYKYVMVDGDILLVHTRTSRVTDAIWNLFD
jgi:hypothetical protein